MRISNVQTVRWLLGAVNGWERPVQIRQAQRWVSRMEAAGMIRWTNIGGPGGAVVWGTFEVNHPTRDRDLRSVGEVRCGRVRVAAGRVAGLGWRPPGGRGGARRPADRGGADSETAPRYGQIFSAYLQRLDRGEASRVVYVCNPDSPRAVRTALTQPVRRRVADRVDVHEVFDPRTTFCGGETLLTWLPPPQARLQEDSAASGRATEQVSTPDRLDRVDDRRSRRGADGIN